MSHIFRVLVLTFAALLVIPVCRAQEPPGTMIRAHLEPAGPVVAGTQVKLVVDVLTTTYFTDAPDWPLFDIPGAIVTLPDEQAQNLTETIDGREWFGVSRTYRIAPQAGRAFDIPPVVIHVTPSGAPAPVTLTTPGLKFEATVPPGAQAMRAFFPTHGLHVSQTLDPAGGSLHVGDTVTRTITQRADGTESILIPPAPLGDVDGLQRYPQPASTQDDLGTGRSLVAGERRDSAMYVVNRSGRFELPAITVEWWNLRTQQIERVDVPALRISARGAADTPLFAIPAEVGAKATHRILVLDLRDLIALGTVILLLVAVVWSWPRLYTKGLRAVRHVRAMYDAWRTGEPHAWRQLRRAARSAPWPGVVTALYQWFDSTGSSPGQAQRKRWSGLGGDDALAIRTLTTATDMPYRPRSQPLSAVDEQRARRAIRRLRVELKKITADA